jgi:agmatinase
MQIAIRDSVTVSIAELSKGILSEIDWVTLVRVSAVLGSTSDAAGSRRTSSKVKASRIFITFLHEQIVWQLAISRMPPLRKAKGTGAASGRGKRWLAGVRAPCLSGRVEQLREFAMSGHGYETGRLNLPFVGISTFGKRPYVGDWGAIDADIAILGAPFDGGTQYRPGARFGPRGVREASTLFSFGHGGAYDHEDDVTYLSSDVRIVDIGDADIVHADTAQSHANIARGVRAILDAGALPVTIGGDHSVNIPCIDAFEGHGDIHILQIDAHLDFVDERHGVRNGHGNPMRRAAEKPYVTGLTQLGIRNVSSTAKDGYDAARAMGSDILSVRQCRDLSASALAARIPEGARVYVTLDIDGFCPSIAPGTGTPSHGGFLYYEVLELLQQVAQRHEVVGIDLVEVAPAYDAADVTSVLAAQVLLNFLGFIMHARRG